MIGRPRGSASSNRIVNQWVVLRQRGQVFTTSDMATSLHLNKRTAGYQADRLWRQGRIALLGRLAADGGHRWIRGTL